MDRRRFVRLAVAGASALRVNHGLTEPAAPRSRLTAPPPENANAAQQFLSWDAGSGPSRDHWSNKLLLAWANSGTGDWLDAAQQAQGPHAYARATVSGGPLTLDVTTLVRHWLDTRKHRGFYLRSTQDWAFTFAGRTHETVAIRPQLRVLSSEGVWVLPCTCNAMWSPSSFKAKDSRGAFSVARQSHFAALNFDLSALRGTIQSATLSLTCLTLKYGGTIEVFELNPPEFRLGGGAPASHQGLASGYVLDDGLLTHPQVLFVSDFSDLSKRQWQSGSVAHGTTQLKDPLNHTVALRGLIPAGELWGCSLARDVVAGSATGVPQTTETELYARYYVLLENDWGSTVDANKMPGWDARLGWWNALGYWQNTTGNGGARPTGFKVWNEKQERWEYEGASMRGLGGPRANDGNPYDELFWVGSYLYHLDQEGAFGEPARWGNVVLPKGRWCCIEQGLKMNSIQAPFDALGNGVAVHDGQYRVWVDGELAYERSNLRWRRHPDMGIQGFWLNWYHGGTRPSPRTMHFRMNAVVIARAYIGPQRGRV